MVERYNTYYGSIDCRSTGREICADGEHVSATDYAALEARLASLDQKFMVLQGSHDLLAAELKKEKEGSRCFELTAKACVRALENEKKELIADRDEWKRRCERIATIIRRADITNGREHQCLAIAEGRDNG